MPDPTREYQGTHEGVKFLFDGDGIMHLFPIAPPAPRSDVPEELFETTVAALREQKARGLSRRHLALKQAQAALNELAASLSDARFDTAPELQGRWKAMLAVGLAESQRRADRQALAEMDREADTCKASLGEANRE
jgi:hypothetical protein